jgi:hypothetical protein
MPAPLDVSWIFLEDFATAIYSKSPRVRFNGLALLGAGRDDL